MGVRLLLLSLAVGCVDAIAFVHAGAFPANMTGNSVLLALSLAHLDAHGITLAGLALLGFIVGAATGARIVRAPGHAWSPQVNAALFLAGGLLLGVNLVLAITGLQFLPGLLLVVAAAMGLQSAAIQHLAIPGVATVFVTGTLTTAVIRLVGPGHSGDAPPPAEPGKWLPALSWVSYFLGALLGALQTISSIPVLLAGPGLILLGVAATATPRKSSPK